MSIHDIIEKINTDKREISFSKWKSKVIFFTMFALFLMQVGVIVWIWRLWG